MGYYVTYEVEALIEKEHIADALKAINDLHAQQKEGHEFSWVGNPPKGGWHEITEAFRNWRWQAGFTEEGDLLIEHFTGEKLGDSETLFTALSPFLVDGSELYCHGEDGESWGWRWQDGKMISRDMVWKDIDE